MCFNDYDTKKQALTDNPMAVCFWNEKKMKFKHLQLRQSGFCFPQPQADTYYGFRLGRTLALLKKLYC